MGQKDKPLLSREDLIAAITRHFATEMKVDYHEEVIGKFLSFKREEARPDLTFPGVRRQGRLRGRNATRLTTTNGAAANTGAANGQTG